MCGYLATAARVKYPAALQRYKLDTPLLAAGSLIQLEVPQEKKEQFYQYASSHPQVMECNCVTGEYSMLLQVSFPSMEDLEHFTGELQQFGKARTHVVFSTPVRHRGIRVEES